MSRLDDIEEFVLEAYALASEWVEEPTDIEVFHAAWTISRDSGIKCPSPDDVRAVFRRIK